MLSFALIYSLSWRLWGWPLPLLAALERGGLVGTCDLVVCVTENDNPWFRGPYAFVLRNAMPVPLQTMRGALGFFEVPDIHPC